MPSFHFCVTSKAYFRLSIRTIDIFLHIISSDLRQLKPIFFKFLQFTLKTTTKYLIFTFFIFYKNKFRVTSKTVYPEFLTQPQENFQFAEKHAGSPTSAIFRSNKQACRAVRKLFDIFCHAGDLNSIDKFAGINAHNVHTHRTGNKLDSIGHCLL